MKEIKKYIAENNPAFVHQMINVWNYFFSVIKVYFLLDVPNKKSNVQLKNVEMTKFIKRPLNLKNV